jgi:hypothetical protein
MNELVIREALVFGGAIAGGLWGYFLGRIVERRQVALEVSASVEALERWAVQVCHGIESLEQSLAKMRSLPPADAPVWNRAEAKAILGDVKAWVPTSARR